MVTLVFCLLIKLKVFGQIHERSFNKDLHFKPDFRQKIILLARITSLLNKKLKNDGEIEAMEFLGLGP